MQQPDTRLVNRRSGRGAPLFTLVALAQGVYYIVTCLWSLLSIDTFQRATGPKTDLWLVKTVGALVGVIGAVLIAGMARSNTAGRAAAPPGPARRSRAGYSETTFCLTVAVP